jgi:hypothetical protein
MASKMPGELSVQGFGGLRNGLISADSLLIWQTQVRQALAGLRRERPDRPDQASQRLARRGQARRGVGNAAVKHLHLLSVKLGQRTGHAWQPFGNQVIESTFNKLA